MSEWMGRAQAAEAQLNTLKANLDQTLERVKIFRENLDNIGIKEKGNGDLDIDFDKFAENLGETNSLELLQIIESKYEAVA